MCQLVSATTDPRHSGESNACIYIYVVSPYTYICDIFVPAKYGAESTAQNQKEVRLSDRLHNGYRGAVVQGADSSNVNETRHFQRISN